MYGVRSVPRHEEASAGGVSFAWQGGLTARQNLAICVGRTTFHAISNTMPSRWFYQDHRWSLINKSVVLIKHIYGLHCEDLNQFNQPPHRSARKSQQTERWNFNQMTPLQHWGRDHATYWAFLTQPLGPFSGNGRACRTLQFTVNNATMSTEKEQNAELWMQGIYL